MDYLAQKILDVLENNINDPAYIADKRQDFEGLDRLGAARKISNLDQENKADLAAVLGVSLQDLDTFIRVLAKL